MASAKPDKQLEATKKKMKKDIQGQIDSADLATGVKTIDTKKSKSGKKNESTTRLDIDDFLKEAEKGFVDVTPEKNDKPFNGNLTNVKIQRISTGDGKY